MIDSPNVPCSEERMDSPNKFKNAIFDYMRRHEKYLHSSQGRDMTLDVMLEILELLKTAPQERSNVAPTGKSDHYYYKTSGWKDYVWKYIVLVDHDFYAASGHFTSILLESIGVATRTIAKSNAVVCEICF